MHVIGRLEKNLEASHTSQIKVFLWRFCHNNLPIRVRLESKGVVLPILCPMCSTDIEHLLRVFFDCSFAKSCWQSVGLSYNMMQVTSAPDWLLNKLDMAKQEEIPNICTVLWGTWIWRNKKSLEMEASKPSYSYGGEFH